MKTHTYSGTISGACPKVSRSRKYPQSAIGLVMIGPDDPTYLKIYRGFGGVGSR